MYEVKITSEFSGAHNLRHYKGKCENLHGHNWKVELAIEAARLDKLGMATDFKDLKRELKKVLDSLDHKYLNKLPFFKDINPTSENIAKFIHDKLDLKSAKITVWETPTSAASYYKKNHAQINTDKSNR